MIPIAKPSEPQRFISSQNTILLLLFVMNLLNYLDRNALSVLAPQFRKELHLSPLDYAYAVNAFLTAYAIMYAGSGAIVDRLGYRLSLGIFVGAWSLAAGLHGAVTGLWTLVLFRFLLGMAEPGGFTGGVKTIALRFNPEQRGLATAIFTAGTGIGSLVTPPLFVYLSLHFGWRVSFLIPLLAGVIWVPSWWYATKDTRPEAGTGGRVAFSLVWLRDPRVVAYILVRFFGDSSGYFFNFWMPEYLVSAKHFSFALMGMVAWIPPCFSDLGAILGGIASGHMVRAGWPPVRCRKTLMTLAALLVLSGSMMQASSHIWQVLTSLSLCTLGVGLWAANLHALPADAFPKPVVATIHGVAGSAGAIGGVLFNTLVGALSAKGQYWAVFASLAMLQPLGVAALWLWMRERSESM